MAIDVAIVRNPATVTSGTTLIHVGNSLGSSFPTMASINADYSFFNQAIALYNRRTNQLMSTPDPVGYLSGKIKAVDITALRTKINTLRTAFGLGSFGFSTATAGAKITKLDLDSLFSALNFSSAKSVSSGTGQTADISQNPYGTTITGPAYTSGLARIGCYSIAFFGPPNPNVFHRIRGGFSIICPTIGAGLATPAEYTVALTFSGFSNTLETYAPKLYYSNTDDHLFPTSPSWHLNLDNLIGSFVYGTTTQSLSLPTSVALARAGTYLSCIIGSDKEFASADASGTGDSTFNVTSQALKYDWGF